MTPLPDINTRHELDQRLRDAVWRDREVINSGQKSLPRGIPYDGRNLRWEDLGTLMADRLDRYGYPFWTPKMAEDALKSRNPTEGTRRRRIDRALPWGERERQAFVRALQEVMNECYDIANSKRGCSLGPPENYYECLGFEAAPVQFHEYGFDPTTIGFFRIMDWNLRRKLDEAENVGIQGAVIAVDRQLDQNWVPPDILQRYLDEEGCKPGSPCPALAGYIEDTREQGNDKLRLMVRKSQYYKNVAIRRCLIDRSDDIYKEVFRRVSAGGQEGLASVVANAPDSNIALNVTVLSRAGNLMVIKRPANTRTYGNSYQLGPHETMNWRESAGRPFETCFDLARRALQEEVGIEYPADYYNRIVFSWFGYYLPEAQGYFFAHVQTRFSEDQLTEMVQGSESRFESDNVEWVSPTEDFAAEVLSGWKSGPFEPLETERERRIYLPHATLSIIQLLRVMKERMLPSVPR